MPKQWKQHIGDDQLVSGLPKHTSAQATGEPVPGDPPYRPKPDSEDTPKKIFWMVYPKENACEKCKAMEGIRYDKKPERPHPNCKCEIKKHEYKPGKRYINGLLTGHGDKATYQFFGLGCVNVDVTNQGSGALLPGVKVHSNWTGWYESLVPPTKTVHFDLNVLADTMCTGVYK